MRLSGNGNFGGAAGNRLYEGMRVTREVFDCGPKTSRLRGKVRYYWQAFVRIARFTGGYEQATIRIRSM